MTREMKICKSKVAISHFGYIFFLIFKKCGYATSNNH